MQEEFKGSKNTELEIAGKMYGRTLDACHARATYLGTISSVLLSSDQVATLSFLVMTGFSVV